MSKSSSSQLNQQLALMQLADSFFPSGTFTLSHGLETLVQTNQIDSPTALAEMVSLSLHQKVGSSELIALVHAHRASFRGDLRAIQQVENLLWSQILVEETRETLSRSGRAFLNVAGSVWSDPQLHSLSQPEPKFHCLHPIVFAVVGRVAGLDEYNTGLSYLHGFVTGLMGAGIRLGILGHIQAQQIRLSLASSMQQICQEACQTNLESMWSFAPLLDIAQINHRDLEQRSFAN